MSEHNKARASQDFRIYADGTVVHEDDFSEYDNAQPYDDDYSVHTVAQEIIDALMDTVNL